MIVGCDRVAANGDVANKVGTYAHALAAAAAGIPFVVVGPVHDDRPALPQPAPRSRSSSGPPTRSATVGCGAADAAVADRARHAVPQPGVRRHPGGARHRAGHRAGRRRAADERVGAGAARRLSRRVSAGTQVLDDPARVADHLAVEHQHRHPPLTAQRLHLGRGATAAGPRHRLECDPVAAQRPRDPAARAQPVGRSVAAIQRGHVRQRYGSEPRSQPDRVAPPARRSGSGCGRPVAPARPRRAAVPVDRLLQAVLVRRGRPAQLTLGLAVGEAPVQRRGAHLDRRGQPRRAEPLGRRRPAPAPPSPAASSPAARTPDSRPRSANSRSS